MATWKKVIVSGSNISQLSNDSLYIHTGSDGVALSGSFSGSFQGDGSGLTGITAAGTLSSSAQIADDISGSFTSTSSSIASDIAGLVVDSGSFSSRIAAQEAFSSSLDTGFASEGDLNTATASLSSSLATDIAAINLFSSSLSSTVIAYTGSFAGDGSGLSGITVDQNATVTASFSAATTASITHNFDSDNIIVITYDDQDEQFLPSTIKAKTADTVEIHFEAPTTGRAVVARGGHIVSGSIPYENLIAVPADIVSGSGQILVVTDGTGVVSGSAQLASDISGSFTSTSSSIATDIATNVSDIADLVTDSGSFSTRIASVEDSVGSGGLLSSSAQIASDISGSVTSLSSSIETRLISVEGSVGAGGLLSSSAQIASDISGSFTSVSSSIASDIASNDADIAGLNTYTSSLKSAITVTGANVTIAGDLEVSGTTTTVDSTTVTFSDNIIALNGTGAANGGIEVNDANGPASGSLLWDGSNNYWIAGGQGSETKVLTKGGNDGLLSGSAQIADNISGSFTSTSSSIASDIASLDSTKADKTAVSGAFTQASSSIATDIDNLQSDSGSLASRIAAQETFSSSLDDTFVTTAELHTATSSLSSSLATDIATRALTANISGSFTSTSSSIASDIAGLVVDSGSLASRIAAQETFSASLDATFATEAELNTATASLSASLATSIAGVEAGALSSGSFAVTLKQDTGSLAFTEGLEIGDVYDLGNGTTDIRVPAGADWLELNYADTDFIWLDGADAGITLDNNYEWRFYGATGTFIAPGEIRTAGAISASSFILTGGELLSGSAQLNTITGVADAISGSFTSVSASIAADIAGLGGDYATDAELAAATASLSASLATDIATNLTSITTLEGKTLVSASVLSSTQQGEVKLTTNGVDGSTIDLGLQTTDTPTFAGLTVNGDLVVTGDTVEAQVTNLNIEDKYILLNSGSTSGDSGIVFGGADGVANSGVGLFWDTSYNSNDGRLGIVNSIAAGATGDQTPSYHIAGVYEGSEANAATAQADHVGNLRVESGEIYIYV